MSKPAPGTPLNLSHPISAGIAIALPLNEGVGSPVDAVTGSTGTLLAGATWSADGIVFGAAGNTSSVAFAGLAGVFAGAAYPCSWTVCWIPHSPSAGGTLLGQWGGSSNTQQVFLLYQAGQSLVIAVTNVDRTAAIVATATAPTFAVGNLTTLTVVWPSPTSFEVYADGVAVPMSYAASGPAGTLNGSPTSAVEIGEASGDAYTADATIVAAYGHKRAITATEAASLHADPYQMFAASSSLLLRRRRAS